MKTKWTKLFTHSAGALLLALATARLLSNLAGAGVAQPRDPVLLLSMRNVLWIFAGLEFAVASVCLFTRQTRFALTLVLWAAFSFGVYQAGFVWQGVTAGFGAYLGGLAQPFGITRAVACFLVRGAYAYLFLGGCVSLVALWLEGRGYTKIACPQCGGHIEYPVGSAGRQVGCPHCGAAVVLGGAAAGLPAAGRA